MIYDQWSPGGEGAGYEEPQEEQGSKRKAQQVQSVEECLGCTRTLHSPDILWRHELERRGGDESQREKGGRQFTRALRLLLSVCFYSKLEGQTLEGSEQRRE